MLAHMRMDYFSRHCGRSRRIDYKTRHGGEVRCGVGEVKCVKNIRQLFGYYHTRRFWGDINHLIHTRTRSIYTNIIIDVCDWYSCRIKCWELKDNCCRPRGVGHTREQMCRSDMTSFESITMSGISDGTRRKGSSERR